MPTKHTEPAPGKTLQRSHSTGGGRRRKSVSKSPTVVLRNASTSVERRYVRTGSRGPLSPVSNDLRYTRQGSRVASTTPTRVYGRHCSSSASRITRQASQLNDMLSASPASRQTTETSQQRRRVASRSAHHDRRAMNIKTLDERLKQTGLQLFGTPREVYKNQGRGYYSVPSPHVRSVSHPAHDETQLQQKGRTLYFEPVPNIHVDPTAPTNGEAAGPKAVSVVEMREAAVVAKLLQKPSPAAQRLASSNPPMYPAGDSGVNARLNSALNGSPNGTPPRRGPTRPLPPPRVVRDDASGFVTSLH